MPLYDIPTTVTGKGGVVLLRVTINNVDAPNRREAEKRAKTYAQVMYHGERMGWGRGLGLFR